MHIVLLILWPADKVEKHALANRLLIAPFSHSLLSLNYWRKTKQNKKKRNMDSIV